MAWLPTRREKILAFGGPKVGKTAMWLGIMELARITKTDSHFWVIDNDNTAEASGLSPYGSLSHLYPMATIWHPESFDEYPDIAAEIKKNASPQDWIVPDMLSNTWEIMPDWWIENVYGSDPWDYYTKVRKAIEEEEPGSKDRDFGGQSGVDWQYIGKVYRAWEKKLTVNSPCHVFAASAETEIMAHHDKSGERRAQYARTSGFAPKCEKGVAHRFHTIIRVTKSLGRDGKTVSSREMTLMGDRDREDVWAEKGGRGGVVELSEGYKFGIDYLVKMAGWKMTGG